MNTFILLTIGAVIGGLGATYIVRPLMAAIRAHQETIKAQDKLVSMKEKTITHYERELEHINTQRASLELEYKSTVSRVTELEVTRQKQAFKDVVSELTIQEQGKLITQLYQALISIHRAELALRLVGVAKDRLIIYMGVKADSIEGAPSSLEVYKKLERLEESPASTLDGLHPVLAVSPGEKGFHPELPSELERYDYASHSKEVNDICTALSIHIDQALGKR